MAVRSPEHTEHAVSAVSAVSAAPGLVHPAPVGMPILATGLLPQFTPSVVGGSVLPQPSATVPLPVTIGALPSLPIGTMPSLPIGTMPAPAPGAAAAATVAVPAGLPTGAAALSSGALPQLGPAVVGPPLPAVPGLPAAERARYASLDYATLSAYSAATVPNVVRHGASMSTLPEFATVNPSMPHMASMPLPGSLPTAAPRQATSLAGLDALSPRISTVELEAQKAEAMRQMQEAHQRLMALQRIAADSAPADAGAAAAAVPAAVMPASGSLPAGAPSAVAAVPAAQHPPVPLFAAVPATAAVPSVPLVPAGAPVIPAPGHPAVLVTKEQQAAAAPPAVPPS